MANIKISALSTITDVNPYVDYVMIWDSSNSDTYNSNQRVIIEDLWAADADFKRLDNAPSVEDSDFVLIYDLSVGGYRKITKGNLYAAPAPVTGKAYQGGGSLEATPWRYTFVGIFYFSTSTYAIANNGSLNQAVSKLSGIHGEGTKGFFCGGEGLVPRLSTVDKITYATDVTVATTALPEICYSPVGLTDRSTKGYSCCGNTAVTDSNKCNRITYATEVWALATTVTTARREIESLEGTTSYGYLGMNQTNGDIDKLTYATEVVTRPYINQAIFRYNNSSGVSNGSTHGYFIGGYAGASTALATKYVFATDTIALQASANFASARSAAEACSANSTTGYSMGGFTNASQGATNFIESTDMTTDTTSTSSAKLLCGFGNFAVITDTMY